MKEITKRGRCHNCRHGIQVTNTREIQQINPEGEIFTVTFFDNQKHYCFVPIKTRFTDKDRGNINYSGLRVRRNFRCPLWQPEI